VAASARGPLIRVSVILFAGLLLAAGGLWLVPPALQALLSGPDRSQRVTHLSGGQVDAILNELVADVAPGPPIALRVEGGVVLRIHRLPPRVDPADVARQLRQQGRRHELELYARAVDGYDVHLRAYAGPDLRTEVLLLADLPPDPVALPARTLRERPQLAIIISGLGEGPASDVLRCGAPLTLSVRPFTPFALPIGRAALAAAHEVIVELVDDAPAADQLAAVPWASGVLATATPPGLLNTPPFGVIVHDRLRPPPAAPGPTRPLGASTARRLGAERALIRARHRAIRDGAAAVTIPADDPALEHVLAWAQQADSDGFRLVHASEAARWEEVRGEPSRAQAPGSGPDPSNPADPSALVPLPRGDARPGEPGPNDPLSEALQSGAPAPSLALPGTEAPRTASPAPETPAPQREVSPQSARPASEESD
jgi:hypothetical protein